MSSLATRLARRPGVVVVSAVVLIGLSIPLSSAGPARAADQTFANPQANMSVTQRYGNLRDGIGYHTGIDTKGDAEIVASASGRVVLVVANGQGDHGLGNAVIVEHHTTTGLVVYSLYGHLKGVDSQIANGSCVAKGQVVGIMGGTGYGERRHWPVHLHFEIKSKAVLGAPKAPNSYWGYTPTNPDDWGYSDPMLHIGSLVAIECGRRVLAGDWNGDGKDSPGFYTAATSTFTFLDSTGQVRERPDQQFGSAGDIPITGDWDGDGVSTAGAFHPSNASFRLTNDSTSPQPDAEVVFRFGETGDVPVAADWDGNGKTDVGTYRDGIWYLDFGRDGGVAERIVNYGVAGDTPIPGNWDARPPDDLIVFRAADPSEGTNRFHFDRDLSGETAERCSKVGDVGDWPLVGDWDGDGDDNAGLYRVRVDQFFLLDALPVLAPAVAVTPTQGVRGTVFEARGSGFACDGTVSSHLRRLGDAERPTIQIQTDDAGSYTHSIDSTSLASGTYLHWAVDDATGVASNVATFEVAAAGGDGAPGTLDSGFDGDGMVTTDFGSTQDGARAVALQPDGRIVAAGSTVSGGVWVVALARYNTEGTLDGSFGDHGRVITGLWAWVCTRPCSCAPARRQDRRRWTGQHHDERRLGRRPLQRRWDPRSCIW